jgi:hypothetical protein
MRLRSHPKLLGKWPPSWTSRRGPATKRAYGERPERLLSVRELDRTVVLEAQYQNKKCTGYLSIDDSKFRKKLLRVLKKNIYKSIRIIGSINLNF